MANDIRFYYSLDDIPNTVKNGNIYFILDRDNNIGSIKVDIENNRYDIKPEPYDLATSSKSGLMSAQDKTKLIPISISQETGGNKNVVIGAANPATNTRFNFLQDILIGSSKKRVLTEDSIQGVQVRAITTEDPVQNSTLRLVESATSPNKFILEMDLNLPTGPTGQRGKPSLITQTIATVDNAIGIPEVTTSLDDWVETEDSFINSLRFDFKNLKGKTGDRGPAGPQGLTGPQGPAGPQGNTTPLEFRFVDGVTTSTTISYEPPGAAIPDKIIYTVTVPRGKEGKEGRSFEVKKFFTSESAMYTAAQITDSSHPDYIPVYSFVLISNGTSDPATGRLFYRTDSNTGAPSYGLAFIEDISPVQPKFNVKKVNTVASNQNAAVTVAPKVAGDWSEMDMTFNIPRGKALKAGTLSTTINKNFGTPSITGSMTTSGSVDQEQLNLSLDFKNMGTITPIGVGNVSIDNVPKAQPTVSITSSTAADGYTQLLNFDFKGLKGAKGDAADSFDTSDTGVRAQHIVDTVDPSRRANVSAETVNGRIQLVFSFYNMQGANGKDGEVKSISETGTGNAVTSITLDSTHKNYLVAHKDTMFATQTYAANANNISSGTVKVANGGTSRTTLTQNSVLVGNGTSAIQMIASAKGAFYATGANAKPAFGTLPVSLGGTGQTALTENAVVLGGKSTTDAVKQVSSASGAFYATGANQTPSFGTLPIAQGGTGGSTFTANGVILGNGTSSFKAVVAGGAGAFYATAKNGQPTFGTLPVAEGGTGKTTLALNGVLLGNTTSGLKTVAASGAGAFYTTKAAASAEPVFGTLPVSVGGTGATTAKNARVNLGAAFVQISHPNTTSTDYYRSVNIPVVNATTKKITYTAIKDFCMKVSNVEYYADSIPT